MTEREFAHILSELTKSLADVIKKGSVEILTPEDECDAATVALNATIGVCAQLLVENMKDPDHPDIVIFNEDIVNDLCALIASRIIKATESITVKIKKPKDE